jgi:uncharacterized membrane protein
MRDLRESTLLPTLTLFGSLGTLLCCALPALLVSIGAGAALAGLVTAVPQLVWFSEHKASVFTFATAMIAVSATLTYRNRNAPCPTDAAQARSCLRVRRFSRVIVYCSIVLYAIGFYFAFAASWLQR